MLGTRETSEIKTVTFCLYFFPLKSSTEIARYILIYFIGRRVKVIAMVFNICSITDFDLGINTHKSVKLLRISYYVGKKKEQKTCFKRPTFEIVRLLLSNNHIE